MAYAAVDLSEDFQPPGFHDFLDKQQFRQQDSQFISLAGSAGHLFLTTRAALLAGVPLRVHCLVIIDELTYVQIPIKTLCFGRWLGNEVGAAGYALQGTQRHCRVRTACCRVRSGLLELPGTHRLLQGTHCRVRTPGYAPLAAGYAPLAAGYAPVHLGRRVQAGGASGRLPRRLAGRESIFKFSHSKSRKKFQNLDLEPNSTRNPLH